MFRLFQRLVTALAAIGVCVAIFFLVSLFYVRVGSVATKVESAYKPKDNVIYMMTFKNSRKPTPSQPKPSNNQSPR